MNCKCGDVTHLVHRTGAIGDMWGFKTNLKKHNMNTDKVQVMCITNGLIGGTELVYFSFNAAGEYTIDIGNNTLIGFTILPIVRRGDGDVVINRVIP